MRLAPLGALLLAASPALAHPGWGIVVDADGAVYYTDLKQVLRIGPEGGTTVVVPNVHTHELYLDAAGTLHGEHLWYESATETWGHYDWELSKKGLVRGPAQKGFRSEGSFVKDAAGNSYWLDGSRIKKKSLTGESIDIPLPRPDDAKGGVVAAAPDGTLYVTSMGGVLRVSADGKVTKVVDKIDEHAWTLVTSQKWHYLMGLAPDDKGNVYVANYGARKVKKVSPDGKVEVVLDASFPWAPAGIAVSPRGIYVLEYSDTGGSVRVRRIDKNGRVTLLR
jgi:streptogramin lyase